MIHTVQALTSFPFGGAFARVAPAVASLLLFSTCHHQLSRSTAAEIDPSKLPPAATRPVDFAKDIEPLLANNCFSCHGPRKQEAGLRLDSLPRPEEAGSRVASRLQG